VIRLIVFAVIGLVIGLGSGSGVAVMRAKKTAAVPAHDSTAKKDSTEVESPKAREEARHDSVAEKHEVAPAPPSTPRKDSLVAGATKATEVKRDSALSVAAHPAPPALPKPVTPPVATKSPTADSTHAVIPAAPGRISKIFAAMSPKDAAKVLQQLDDSDVQTVLSGLNDRQAAAILAGFPAERAAAISRAVMRGRKGAS
jgi:hypothetical protein